MTNKKSYNPTTQGQADAIIQKYMAGQGLRQLVRLAIEEDLGSGDPASCIFSEKAKGNAYFLAKSDGVLSGSAVANTVFKELNKGVKLTWHFKDGDTFATGDNLASIQGSMRALLQGERIALNFLQRLSGIATLTAQFVEAAGKNKTAPGIYDTRKTTPLLRVLEKKAVLDGGGRSHRFALYDMAMLKNNHIDAAGGVAEAVNKLAENGFYNRKPPIGLCIEARTLNEAVEAAWCRADIIMLDNMTPAQITKAAEAVKREAAHVGAPMPQLEVSGGITLKTIKKYATLPVQRISVGALTHSAPALDISMRYTEDKP